MRDLYTALRGFIRNDFNLQAYGLTMLFLAVAIFINYSPSIDISTINLRTGAANRLLYYGVLFGGTYFFAALVAARGAAHDYLKDWRFWVLASAFIFIALSPKLYIFRFLDVREQGWELGEMHFVARCHFFVNQMVLALIGLGMVRVLFNRWASFDYGFRGDWKTLRPYLLVLLLVSPLIIGASFLPDFQKAYPQYRPWRFMEVFSTTMTQRAAIFELSYATGFVAVESIFRGALALTMVRIMGSRAILPMAAFYCVFHFGKPMGEAISAFFGGYALGVLAVHSKSILGGLIVHLGVAMLMESLAYLHHLL